jgi:hypothetical protein
MDGKYSEGLQTAGMLGYVLIGHPQTIVAQINSSMHDKHRQRQLPATANLQAIAPRDDFQNLYKSKHERGNSQQPITLYHLFLTFDFDGPYPGSYRCTT